MRRVIFSNNNGLGLIASVGEDESTFIRKEPVFVGGETIQPEQKTDLQGYFKHPITFAGLLKEDKRVLVFRLGEESDLFESNVYYQCIYRITENRLFQKYTDLSGRDYRFINGRWK